MHAGTQRSDSWRACPSGSSDTGDEDRRVDHASTPRLWQLRRQRSGLAFPVRGGTCESCRRVVSRTGLPKRRMLLGRRPESRASSQAVSALGADPLPRQPAVSVGATPRPALPAESEFRPAVQPAIGSTSGTQSRACPSRTPAVLRPPRQISTSTASKHRATP